MRYRVHWKTGVRKVGIAVAALVTIGLFLTPALGGSGGLSADAGTPHMSQSSILGLLGNTRAGTPLTGNRMGHDAACDPPYGWLTTQGDWIVETKDPSCKIRLAGVSWFGMQSNTYALAGLNFEKYTTILDEVAAMGFNSIRIPLSDELVRDSAHVVINHKKFLRANPELPKNLHPLQLLDDVVSYAATLNIMIILDNHFTKAVPASGTPPAQNQVARHASRLTQARAAIRSAAGAEAKWVADWVTLTKRYLNDPNVIGFDLRNEPHTQWNGKWWNLKDYLTNGATWGPCTKKLCGKLAHLWKKSSDWVSQAETAGDAVLAVNPKLLMFVEGVQLYPNPKAKTGIYSYWWGGILRGVAVDPVKFAVKGLPVPDQLVYSPHVWGPWKCCDPDGEFTDMTYQSIADNYYENWAYILSSKNPSIQAPIWIGEFNTCNAAMKGEKGTNLGWIKPAGACVSSSKAGSEGQWFQIFIKYLQNNPEINWSYYPLNGTNEEDGQSNNSILGCRRGTSWPKCNPWAQARLPAIVTALQTIESSP